MTTQSTPPNPADSQGDRPIPDPTVLTTDNLRREIGHLTDLVEEKMKGMEQRIGTAEEWRREQKLDTQTSIAAALQAQKEAAVTQDENNQKSIDKSERAMDEKVNKLEQLFKTTTDALADKVDDLKTTQSTQASLINGAYQQRQGVQDQKVEQRAVTAGQVAFGGLIVTVVSLIIGYLIANPPG